MPCFGYGRRERPVMTESQSKILHEIEILATTMDKTLFKICGFGICLDGIVGFVPVVGDFSTSLVSAWIVLRSWFAFDKLWRRKGCVMFLNVFIDFMIGTIPVFGDIFDIGWKSNVRNVNIVRKFYGMEPMILDAVTIGGGTPTTNANTTDVEGNDSSPVDTANDDVVQQEAETQTKTKK